MTNRRQFLLTGAAVTVAGVLGFAPVGRAAPEGDFPYKLTDAQWRKKLSADQYSILRQEGTETPGSHPLLREKRRGVYQCAGCGLPAYSSATKFESGTGWPSFYAALPGGTATSTDFKIGYPRTEEHCARCGSHLGHIFDDGPKPTGKRHCINGLALTFSPRKA